MQKFSGIKQVFDKFSGNNTIKFLPQVKILGITDNYVISFSLKNFHLCFGKI